MTEPEPLPAGTEFECLGCGDTHVAKHDFEHHRLCCDCFDLNLGKPEYLVNSDHVRKWKLKRSMR